MTRRHRLELHGKRPGNAREGVGHPWLVEPADRTREAFELRDRQWVRIAGAKDDNPISIPPFDAVTFSLGDLLFLWWAVRDSNPGSAHQE